MREDEDMVPNEEAVPVGEVVVLGESRMWPGVLLPAALTIVVVVYYGAYLTTVLGLVVAALIVALVRRRNAVLADDQGILIRNRRGLRRSYDWSQIERMGWVSAPGWGATLTVYPRGGPYDVPGPNSPAEVAGIWPKRRSTTPDPLPGLRDRHGIEPLYEKSPRGAR
ncbi:hypothetical protein AB0J83_18210 [Actinoplanes sp. NPDC049596]|uniref:hypothetical protein n=1 Tax=unclassified Actinoplanes TaxID=2626549 RepID=UPI00341A7B7D